MAKKKSGGKRSKRKEQPVKTGRIVEEMIVSYWMELETVQNYLANSTNLTGVLAKEIKQSLAADVPAELGHAQQLAARIHVLGGKVPGSAGFRAGQKKLQPPKDNTDMVSVILGVIDAEEGAIEQYQKIIRLCDGVDYATQDMAITLLADEQGHRREFVGFLAEFDKKAAAKLG